MDIQNYISSGYKYFSAACAVLFILFLPAAQAEVPTVAGVYINTGKAVLYTSPNLQGRVYYTSRSYAFNVLNIVKSPKNDLLYEIEYPFTKDTVKLKGYVVLSEESVDKTTDSTSDKIVHVFKEIPADEEAYPDYESVPARMLKYTGTGGESRLYPKIRWYEVSYELQKPRRYWVKSTGGLFREYGNAEVVNPLLKAVKSGKYTAEQAENMVMGIVKAGYSLQDIELTLGQPISKTPREPSGQLWVYHGVTVELSAEGKAVKVSYP